MKSFNNIIAALGIGASLSAGVANAGECSRVKIIDNTSGQVIATLSKGQSEPIFEVEKSSVMKPNGNIEIGNIVKRKIVVTLSPEGDEIKSGFKSYNLDNSCKFDAKDLLS